jgi:hypothetical protein
MKSRETGLAKAAAGFAIMMLISLTLWGLSVYLIHGDGDTYPGGALGVVAFIGFGGVAIAVAGLVVVCLIGLVRVTLKAFRPRGEQ